MVVLLPDTPIHVHVLEQLARSESLEIPFDISNDISAEELKVDLPGVPGWGISHSARDDPESDRLLRSLESVYAKLKQGDVPPYFRQ